MFRCHVIWFALKNQMLTNDIPQTRLTVSRGTPQIEHEHDCNCVTAGERIDQRATTRIPAGCEVVVVLPSEPVIDFTIRGGMRTPSVASIW